MLVLAQGIPSAVYGRQVHYQRTMSRVPVHHPRKLCNSLDFTITKQRRANTRSEREKGKNKLSLWGDQDEHNYQKTVGKLASQDGLPVKVYVWEPGINLGGCRSWWTAIWDGNKTMVWPITHLACLERAKTRPGSLNAKAHVLHTWGLSSVPGTTKQKQNPKPKQRFTTLPQKEGRKELFNPFVYVHKILPSIIHHLPNTYWLNDIWSSFDLSTKWINISFVSLFQVFDKKKKKQYIWMQV